MSTATLIAVDPDCSPGGRVNIFVHGYRSMGTPAEVEAARLRVLRTGVVGESYLLRWMAGRWSDSASVAGLRAAYKATRFRYALSPWSLLVDAGMIGLHEASQFKLMERRAEHVGRELPAIIAQVAKGRPINLIGHSLGARIVHHALANSHEADLTLEDAVLLAGAADLEAKNWTDCVRLLRGRLYNAYSPKDRVLRMTPDIRRRVGVRPLPSVVVDGIEKVVNLPCPEVAHVDHWTRLPELLPTLWPGCGVAIAAPRDDGPSC